SFNIDEGPLTQVRQIRFEGVEAFTRAQLLALIKIKTGAALSLKDLDETRQILKDFYTSEGYLEMKITNEKERGGIVSYNDSNTQANVQFNIYEGPRVIVREVDIKGNSFTKDHVIRRELTFAPGDVLTPDKIADSTLRLQSLGLFSRVDVRMPDAGTALAERTIQVEVDEAIPGDVRIGIGANNEQELTFRGYVAASYSNLNGTGRGLHLRIEPKYSTEPRISYIENRTTLSYLEPYVFGIRNRGRVNLVRDQSFFGYTGTADAIIQEENSVGFLLEKELSRTLKLTTTVYSFANQLQFNRRTKDTLSTQNIAKTGPLLEFDTRDNIANATKGVYTFINAEYSDPAIGSSQDATQTIHFAKTNASFSFYQQLFGKRDLIWANSLRGGYLANLSNASNSGVPSQESFFLGGRATIRGFDANDLERIPNRIDLGIPSLANFRMTSDSHYYLIKSEIRFPLWRNSPVGQLGGVFFYDGGAVILSQLELPDPYRDAAGFGLRLETPVGPINLEIGWKLDRRLLQVGTPSDIRESAWAFHFSIGSF
ncbi:MAG: BamA/TamA family outer membrane protein, partial [Bdellovibrionota bacterium]